MSLYFFYGEEDFLIEKETESIKNKVLDVNINELTYKTADNPDFCDFVFLLKSQPMMLGDSVIVIKAESYFLEGKKNKLDDAQIAEITDALDLISDRVHIILTCTIPRGERKKPDSRKKLYKAIQKAGTIKEFQAFKPYEDYKVLPVLKNMMKNYNLKASDTELKELIRLNGTYLRDLDSALDKLSLYLYPENIITKEALGNIFQTNKNIFLLSDLILENKITKAMFEISNMLNTSHYLEILSFLQSSFTKILLTKIYSNLTPFEIAKKTSQNEYAVKMTLNKIKNIELNRLLRLKTNLTQAEYEIKTGEKEPLTALNEAFIK